MFLVVYDGWDGGYGCEMYAAGIFNLRIDAEKCRDNVKKKLIELSPNAYEDYDEDLWEITVKIIEIKPNTDYTADIKKDYCLENELDIGGYIE